MGDEKRTERMNQTVGDLDVAIESIQKEAKAVEADPKVNITQGVMLYLTVSLEGGSTR